MYIEGGQVNVRGSTIANNQGNGITISNLGISDLTVSNTNISGNGNYGLFNAGSGLYRVVNATVDARNNWWGDASGPYHPSGNSTGQGDRVSDNVLFDPWLTEPLAVQLANFTATAQADQVLVTWQTVSELDNLGFNLYRNSSPDAPSEPLNSSLIPSQAPGSGQGMSYEWLDNSVQEAVTYYYWLEDVDLDGTTTLHGPVSATANVPTAVTLREMASRQAQPWGLIALMLTMLAGVWVVWLKLQS
jgi:hypothetical protein